MNIFYDEKKWGTKSIEIHWNIFYDEKLSEAQSIEMFSFFIVYMKIGIYLQFTYL